MNPREEKTDTNYAIHLSWLVKNDPKHGYILLGNSEYLKNLFLTSLKKKISAESDTDFQILFGDELDLNKLKDTLESNNFFYTKKLIYIRHFFSLSKKATKDLTTMNMFSKIPDDTFVVIENEGTSRDFSSILKKSFPSFHVLEDISLDKKQFETWIKKRFDSLKMNPSASIISEFCEACSYDLDFTIQTINRVALQCRDQEVDWKSIINEYRKEQNEIIFSLSDAIMQDKSDHALQILGNLIRQGKSAEELFYYLLNHFQFLSTVKLISIDYRDKYNVVTAMPGQSRFRVEKAYDQIRDISLSMLHALYGELVQIDKWIKTGYELDLTNSLTLWIGKKRFS